MQDLVPAHGSDPMLVERKNAVLAAWEDGFLTAADVHQWADRRLLAIPDPRDIPVWLLDLVTYGPNRCLDIPGFGWPQPLDYRSMFALRASRLQLDDTVRVAEFAQWAARAACGQDPAREVHFGYYLDFLLDDCCRMDRAVAYVRRTLPRLLDACRARASRILDLGT